MLRFLLVECWSRNWIMEVCVLFISRILVLGICYFLELGFRDFKILSFFSFLVFYLLVGLRGYV